MPRGTCRRTPRMRMEKYQKECPPKRGRKVKWLLRREKEVRKEPSMLM